ncbi:MAG: hypothetical protein JW768_08210 [Chitinispirillaceae bacterium]|nr:hypothetical protein [Chitinispirillaceae bacterium]
MNLCLRIHAGTFVVLLFVLVLSINGQTSGFSIQGRKVIDKTVTPNRR